MARKQNIWNSYARHNASILDPIMVATIKHGDYRNSGSSLLRCVSCGRYRITCGVVKYFDYNPSKLLCRDCQEARQNTQPVAIGDILTARLNY